VGSTFQPTFRFILSRHVEGYAERLGKRCAKCTRELDPEYWFHRADAGCSPDGAEYCQRSTKTAIQATEKATVHA
jgi:hypothetical protein